jgi:hypothetical protein
LDPIYKIEKHLLDAEEVDSAATATLAAKKASGKK